MNQINQLRVFLGSPSDTKEERDIVIQIFDELNKTIGIVNNLTIKTLTWENYVYPSIGSPQDVINEQMSNHYDVFLCIFWTKLGTPTLSAESGTIEELNNAISRFQNGDDVQVMVYFKTGSPKLISELGSEYQNVLNYKRNLNFSLYREFVDPKEFAGIFRQDFTNFLNSKFQKMSPNNTLTKLTDIQIKIILNKIAKKVELLGDFTGWDKNPVLLDTDDNLIFKKSIKLPTGTYQFKIKVDGQWKENMDDGYKITLNPFGTFNYVLEID